MITKQTNPGALPGSAARSKVQALSSVTLIMRAFLVLSAALYLCPFPALGASPWEHPTPPGYAALMEREPGLAYHGASAWQADMGLLRVVNFFGNALASQPDAENADVWGKGSDCEDLALAKLRLLLSAGVPRGALMLAVVDLWGNHHAVLVVSGLYVLDSLTPEIHFVDDYPGTFIATEGVEGWRRATRRVELEDLIP
jgi:predicted transglutaminase-like cysteine proteinase